ncbi:hypothetical protein ACP8HI_01815 [Paenibacillus sp. FA6]|uniref:hypothetical protein n=1 Tax=Paenibacillus sp. FA6 TaxID=3413029 RepID=UPI003F658BEE
MNYNKNPRFMILISSILLIAVISGVLVLGASVGKTNAENNIQTDLYQLSLPEEWSIEEMPFSSLSFKENGNVIGGLDPNVYYPDQPISQVLPNHSEVIESKKLEGFFTEVILKKLKRTPPAASGETTVLEQIHIYFIMKDKEMVYDLYFNTEYIDEQTALSIARSFNLKPSNG